MFPSDYFEARRRFRAMCADKSLSLRFIKSPAEGPGGEDLSIDIARAGPSNAEAVLVLTSGLHGVEGFCGSGCQLDWLSNYSSNTLPTGLAVVLVHFLNPYGGAWVCVESEDNIDLNRNFLDFSRPLPVHETYAELHQALTCPEYAGPQRDRAEQAIRDFVDTKGLDAFLDAAARGQYSHPGGFNFGGQQPAWSNNVVRELLEEETRNAKRLALIDYHTGLGPYGHGTVIFDGREDSAAGNLVRDRHGPDVAFLETGQIGYTTTGGFATGGMSHLTCPEKVGIVLEFGTWGISRVADAMRRSFWLQRFGSYDNPAGEAIRAELKDAFFVASDDWQSMVVHRSRQVIAQATEGIVSRNSRYS